MNKGEVFAPENIDSKGSSKRKLEWKELTLLASNNYFTGSLK